MDQKIDRNPGLGAVRARWKPPIWLLLLDAASLLVLSLGLWLHFAPESGLAQALPPAAKWPLMAVGGAFFLLCWLLLLRSLLAAHRRA